MILLMPDSSMQVIKSDSPHYKMLMDGERELSGFGHILASVSHKAKRVSNSTSTSETLAAVIGKELGQLVALRLTEIVGAGVQLPLNTASPLSLLIEIQEAGGSFRSTTTRIAEICSSSWSATKECHRIVSRGYTFSAFARTG